MKTQLDVAPAPTGPIATRSLNPALVAAAQAVNRACAERPLDRAAVRRSLGRLGAIRALVRAVEKLTKGGATSSTAGMVTPLPDRAGAVAPGGLRLDPVEISLWVGARAARNGLASDVGAIFKGDTALTLAYQGGVYLYRSGASDPELLADVEQLAAVELALMQLRDASS